MSVGLVVAVYHELSVKICDPGRYCSLSGSGELYVHVRQEHCTLHEEGVVLHSQRVVFVQAAPVGPRDGEPHILDCNEAVILAV